MTVQHVTDLSTPIGEILAAVSTEGILLESKEQRRFAIIPLDDDLIDYLVERSPTFIEDCRQIREQMRGGKYHSHEVVRKLLMDG
jgi:hypothetical protein